MLQVTRDADPSGVRARINALLAEGGRCAQDYGADTAGGQRIKDVIGRSSYLVRCNTLYRLRTSTENRSGVASLALRRHLLDSARSEPVARRLGGVAAGRWQSQRWRHS